MSFQNSYLPLSKIVANYGNLGRTYSVFDFVRAISSANSAVEISSDNFIKAPGKKRPFVLNTFPILCDQTGSCETDVCTMDGEKVELAQRVYDITQCIASPVYKLEKDDVRLIDAEWTFSQVMQQIIKSALPDFRRRLAIAMVARLYALSGVHTDGSATKRVVSTNAATGVVNPMSRFLIDREYLDAGLQMPYVFGGAEVYNWKAMVGIGDTNNYGQNIGKLNTDSFYYDDGLSGLVLNDLANGDWMLSVDPSVFKFVTYSDNSGIFTTGLVNLSDIGKLYQLNGMGNLLEGTYYDQVTGFVYDLYARYDCGVWNVMFKFNWDFVVLPDTVCGVQGLNGIMKWRTCPPIAIDCPTGTPVTPAPAATEYSWTPTLSAIPTISTISIGGVSYTSNTPIQITTLADLAAALNEAYSPGTTTFTVSGTDIVYTGYTALGGTLNNSVTVTFS